MLNNTSGLNLNMGTEPKSPDAWQRLTDYYNKISGDQRLYVENHETVVAAQQRLMEAFQLFLFTKFKHEMCQEATFQQFCDAYVNAVLAAGENYSERVSNVFNENEALRARVAELEGKLNE